LYTEYSLVSIPTPPLPLEAAKPPSTFWGILNPLAQPKQLK
jgi:hypothetical protein